MKKQLLIIFSAIASLFYVSCDTTSALSNYRDDSSEILVSVRDQKMLLTKNGVPVKSYPISTSKFGLGSKNGSKRTPLGNMEIAQKVGDGAPSGSVFKSRKRTGEVLKPNAPGRDPVVTRILWLTGKDRHNRNTYGRYIYIHGTPEEYKIGKPASYGCIRMKSKDVIDLYKRVGVGADVKVMRSGLSSTPEGRQYAKINKKFRDSIAYND